MEPEKLTAWVSILRDLVIVAVAAFMLIYGVTRVHEPTILSVIIGGGLTLLGVPPFLRADDRRRRNGQK